MQTNGQLRAYALQCFFFVSKEDRDIDNMEGGGQCQNYFSVENKDQDDIRLALALRTKTVVTPG